MRPSGENTGPLAVPAPPTSKVASPPLRGSVQISPP
jgi:hypothetical protein